MKKLNSRSFGVIYRLCAMQDHNTDRRMAKKQTLSHEDKAVLAEITKGTWRRSKMPNGSIMRPPCLLRPRRSAGRSFSIRFQWRNWPR